MSNYGIIISEDDQALLLSFKLVPTVLTTYVKASMLATKKQTKIKYTLQSALSQLVLNLAFASSLA
jgi:hypothetical protein